MNKITIQAIDGFLVSDINFTRLDNFIRKYSVYEDYKKEIGDSFKSVIERLWGSANLKFRDPHGAPDSLVASDYLAAMEFDIVISPYTGVSFDKRKEFYLWCFDQLKKLL